MGAKRPINKVSLAGFGEYFVYSGQYCLYSSPVLLCLIFILKVIFNSKLFLFPRESIRTYQSVNKANLGANQSFHLCGTENRSENRREKIQRVTD